MRDRAASRRAVLTGFFARRVSARAAVRFAAFAALAGFATFAAAVAFTALAAVAAFVAFVPLPRFTAFAGVFTTFLSSARFGAVERAVVPFFDVLPFADAFPFLDAVPGFGDTPFAFTRLASFVVRACLALPFALPAPFGRTAFADAPWAGLAFAGLPFATPAFVGTTSTGAPFAFPGFAGGAAGAAGGGATTGARFVAARRSIAGDGLVWGCWRRSATRLTSVP